MAHGGGGKAMRDLIDDVFVSAFDNATLATLEDQARFRLADLAGLRRPARDDDGFLRRRSADLPRRRHRQARRLRHGQRSRRRRRRCRSISPAPSSSRKAWRSNCCARSRDRWPRRRARPASPSSPATPRSSTGAPATSSSSTPPASASSAQAINLGADRVHARATRSWSTACSATTAPRSSMPAAT